MLVAIPVWHGRVSVAFDFARRVLLVRLDGGVETSRTEMDLNDDPPLVRTRKLARHGVELLICGAVSGQSAELLASQGIKVIADVCGGVEEVLEAYRGGRLDDPGFLLPGRSGCPANRRRSGRCRRGARTPVI